VTAKEVQPDGRESVSFVGIDVGVQVPRPLRSHARLARVICSSPIQTVRSAASHQIDALPVTS
jgi:hypothetical protein